MRCANIEINTLALKHNLQQVKKLAPHSKVVSMVKANAYGHGVKHCIDALAETDAFGVATFSEALELRELGCQHNITLIEGVFSLDEMHLAVEQNFDCAIHQDEQLKWLLEVKESYLNKKLKVWLKFNSGMNRLGFTFDDILKHIELLNSLGFECIVAMHFANADVPEHPLNQKQIQQLLTIQKLYPDIALSCCNSAAIYNWPELHFDYVRPGIMLYGASPFANKNIHELNLKPVMTFNSAIMATYKVKKGEHIGYGSLFTAEEDMTIAIVSVGYGDGYPRNFIHTNYVAIDQQFYPVIGRVSMDMIMIDLKNESFELNTIVELWGDNRLVDDVAQCNNTIGYELLCRVTTRPVRKQVEHE